MMIITSKKQLAIHIQLDHFHININIKKDMYMFIKKKIKTLLFFIYQKGIIQRYLLIEKNILLLYSTQLF